MKKYEVLAAIDRRMAECAKICESPDRHESVKSRASAVWHALLSLKVEIRDMGTKRESGDHPFWM